MFAKSMDTKAGVADVFHQRWSGVAFDPERDLDDQSLLSLAEAARWAPSCFGDQPWRFIFCRKSTDPEAWQKAFDCLMEGNQVWNKHVPVLVMICADTLFTLNDKPNRYGPYDTGAAAVSLCLQAASMGIMTHQMAGFSADAARESFSIPERYQPLAMMAVGYQLAEDSIPEEFREKEQTPRARRPLGESFFSGDWGKPLD
jgi:nitroreductase